MLIDFGEETEKIKHDSLIFGVPGLRFVEASRTAPGPEEAERITKFVLSALTSPLTEEEKKGGRWASSEQRVLFEGTIEDAEEFYNQTEILPRIGNVPFAKYTDGLPIVIPTEERVEKMLSGTSHKPDELIILQRDVVPVEGGGMGRIRARDKGQVVKFMPLGRTATVEQVAVNAVMAGCKPEYFPVVLAIAESGGGTGDGRGNGGGFVMSGPIYKEIGMNVSYGRFSPGFPANKSIARVGSLLWRNLGGYKESVTTIMTYGSPSTNGGFICAEYAEGLPPGWKGLNEELGFNKDESIIMPMAPGEGGIGQTWMPGIYRWCQNSGYGAMARYLEVEGTPGPHNWLPYLIEGLWAAREGGITIVMVPSMAKDLYDVGFKSKDEIYEWIWNQSFETVKKYRLRGAPDYMTNGWRGIERTSGKPWKDLPGDYMVPAGGASPRANCIIIGAGEETSCQRFGGGHGSGYSIDAWR